MFSFSISVSMSVTDITKMLLPCCRPSRWFSTTTTFIVQLSLLAVLSTKVLGYYDSDYYGTGSGGDSIDQYFALKQNKFRGYAENDDISGNVLQNRQGRMLFSKNNINNFSPPVATIPTIDDYDDAAAPAVNTNLNHRSSLYAADNNNNLVHDSDPAATAAGNTNQVQYEKTVVLPTEYYSSGQNTKVKTTKKIQKIIQNRYTRIHQHNKVIQNQINDRYSATYYRPLTKRYITKHHQTNIIRHTRPVLNKVYVNLHQDIYKPQELSKIIRTYDTSVQKVLKPTKFNVENRRERLKTVWEPVRNLGTEVINGDGLLYGAAAGSSPNESNDVLSLTQHSTAKPNNDYLRKIWPDNDNNGYDNQLASRYSDSDQQNSADDAAPINDEDQQLSAVDSNEARQAALRML